VADPLDDALIREVNDDLREERMMKLWKRFGGSIVGVAVLIIVIVAGYQGWKQYDFSARGREGERFHAAQQLAKSGDMDGARQAFALLSVDASSGYGVLARFQQAALLSIKGDSKGAARLYQRIAHDTASDVALSGLADIQGAMVEINAGGYAVPAMKLRLQTLSGGDQPYRYSARELLGLIAIDAGETTKAHDLFKQLSGDAAAPRGIRNRAKNMMQYLGN